MKHVFPDIYITESFGGILYKSVAIVCAEQKTYRRVVARLHDFMAIYEETVLSGVQRDE